METWHFSGYANEVGEAFRSMVHVNVVRFSYLVASSYVAADAVHKGQEASQVRFNTVDSYYQTVTFVPSLVYLFVRSFVCLSVRSFLRVSDCCLKPNEQFFSYIIMREPVTFWWYDDDDARFVLDQHTGTC
jgi:hypothetical protein